MADKTNKSTISKAPHTSRAQLSISAVGIESRIGAIADGLGGNSALAKICGVAEGTVRNWRTGPSEPTASNLVAIARAGKVTVEWLATGAPPKDPAHVANVEGYISIPLYDARSISECNALFDGKPAARSIIVPSVWPIEHARTESSRLAFYRMYGDGMSPALQDGDMLLLDCVDTAVSDGIYVFFIDGFTFCQRLQRKPGEDVYFQDGNMAREPRPLPYFEEFKERSGVVGRVVWVGRKL